MLPDPLHPAVVHFPVVLGTLLPLVIVAALLVIGRGTPARSAWGWVMAVAAALAVSSVVAVRTGEPEEERVEDVVPERVIHEHEEMAERTQWLAIATLVISAGGLAGGMLGRIARPTTFALSLATAILMVLTGKLGGELVYTHGAASAYTAGPAAPAAGAPRMEDD